MSREGYEPDARPLSLVATFDSIVSIAERTLPMNGRVIKIDIDPQIPRYLLLEEQRFKQMLFQLIEDAVRSEVSGEIRLSTEATSEADGMTISIVIAQECLLPRPRYDRHIFKSIAIDFLRLDRVAIVSEPWPRPCR